jgi:hypothetical protein
VVLTAVVTLRAAWHVNRAEQAELDGVDGMLALVAPGTRLLTLEFERGSRFADGSPWINVGALHRLKGGGVTYPSFAEVPHWPVHFRPESQPPRIPGRSDDWHPCEFRNSVDGPYYDYVLVRGRVDTLRHEPSGPRWQLLALSYQERSAPWALFKKVPGGEVSGRADLGPCAPEGR